ncbi:GntR family transcriptional regulator [Rhizobium sp. SSA_523]|uniref:GntR family transcriptional regulator n=1 Tax=Rhizobium sp. SSA_523 TaxID=2952477 RepID=UPI0020913831|nr:GntR family transcriptional regulator [Rhizobium sp. SSA_523]MCO5734475.1 GntR family transcriptional regulator [Rhizobium sp. SSA_523]WKC23276.1 GntR family transcriptional regulator [Rhizobium sp. SSA_523]
MRAQAESMAHKVERQLRADILALALPPGTRISEQEIGERYGSSRQPGREALIGLAKSRLVEILPQRGAVIARISVDKLMQAAFIRETIETAVVKAACRVFHVQARSRLEASLGEQKRAAAAGDRSAFRQADTAFHKLLAEGAGLPMAWSVVEDLKAHIDRACCLSLQAPDALSRLVGEHQAILGAIDRRDEAGAVHSMTSHLSELLHDLPQLEMQYPDLFE